MHYQTLLSECADRILTVTLNRPAKLNAMSATMLAELRAVFSAAATDPAVSVVVLRASGRAFTVGYDLNEADWLLCQYPANFDGQVDLDRDRQDIRSEEHTSELPSLMRISSAALCLIRQSYNTPQNHSSYSTSIKHH